MQSFIVISKNPQKRQEYIQEFCATHSISQFDQHHIAPEESSLGIKQIRNMQTSVYLYPQKGNEKAIIIEDAQLLTTEAQNALLKLLEEPPTSTYIFLSGNSQESFLPTIISRCKTITFEEITEILSDNRKKEIQNALQTMQSESINDRLVLAEKTAKEKEGIGKWFEDCILTLREEMLTNPTDVKNVQLISVLQEGYKLFQTTNVSPRMLLEHVFLSLE